MSKEIYPCLWFKDEAKEAANYYCSIFRNSKIITENAVVVWFELNGNKIMALNGKSGMEFNESHSMVVHCDTQDEIDYYWNKFTADGEESMCGWLKDKYGVSWQIVPSMLPELMQYPQRFERIMKVVMPMRKLDIKKIIEA